jgi:chaperonin GroEL
MKEKKARVEDALHATRAAVEEGIVPGGGVALLRCSQVLNSLKLDDAEEMIGVRIIKQALEAPIRQIALNAGYEGSVLIEKILLDKTINVGFDANDGKIKDLVAEGVIDPTKVTRSALQNAASIAALLLTTETMVTEIPEKKEAGGHGMPGGMGGGMPDMM